MHAVVLIIVPPNKNSYAPTMLDWNQCPTVEGVPGKVSGVWLFKGTRVPVKALFENLEDGAFGRFPAVFSGREAGAGARDP